MNTFGFDLENRMLSASKAGMSAVYTYDPLGRRVAKSVNGVGTATFAVILFSKRLQQPASNCLIQSTPKPR
ncbi:hypothetical protein [Hyphomonas sp.]|uniref:hypothetical protein n=1 Tax=Hyphomonas sp. TaxID=87 RepID=UPI0037C0E662